MSQRSAAVAAAAADLKAWITQCSVDLPGLALSNVRTSDVPDTAGQSVLGARTRRRKEGGVAPYSFREAAALLHLDRTNTLNALVSSGQLETVPWGREVRIPRTEVERLARDGFTASGAKPVRSGMAAAKKPLRGVGAAILALPHGRTRRRPAF